MDILLKTGVFMYENSGFVLGLTITHLGLVIGAVGLAIVSGIAIGIVIARTPAAAKVVFALASVVLTVPSIALFGLMMPVLALIGHGIGALPAMIAVFLYSQLPIIGNTYAAINGIDPGVREAARGIGMTGIQRLFRVELPIALPIIAAGVRIAAVRNIGVMAVAVYIGAGGLGTLISRGIAQSDPRQLIAGALLISIMAIAVDYLFHLIERKSSTS
ncbi:MULTISPECIES: ABC transporter permease [Hyphomicrobiales]|jgi:osmoprotectant transport system permease protein|uniref:ABC transporter permease n=1 Tax=Methylobacterium sp. CCH7-A2 TaxID=1768789 RepID=UPI00082BFC16|nr:MULTISPECIES: ABC transporter permease [Hyphomicrobiales]